MATRKRVIEYIFQSTDKTSKVMREMADSSDAFGKSLTNTVSPIANFSTNLLKVEAAIIAVGVAFTAFAVNKAIQFQDALTELNKVLGDGEGDLDALGLRAIAAGNKFGEFGSDVLQSAAGFKQAGFTIDESFGLVESSLTAARISELEAAEASQLLIRVLKGFEIPASEAARVLDLANEASANYAVSLPQLLESLARTSSVSKSANISIEESIGILTNIIQPIQNAEIASSAYNTSIQRLGSLNTEVAKGFALLGLSVADTNPEFNTTSEVLRKVQEQFVQLTPGIQSVVAQYLVGQEQSAKFSRALSGLGLQTAITATAVGGIGVSSSDELAKAMANTSTQVDRAGATFTNLLSIIGTPLLSGTSAVSASLADLNIQLQELATGGSLGQFSALFDQAATRLTEFINQVATNLPAALENVDLSGLTGSIEGLFASLQGLGEALDIGSDTDSLAASIQTVIDAITGLTSFTSGFVTVATPFIAIFKEILDIVLLLPPEFAEVAGGVGAFAVGLTALAGTIAVGSGAIKGLSFLLAGPQGSLASALTAGSTGILGLSAGLLAFGPIAFGVGKFLGDLVNSSEQLKRPFNEVFGAIGSLLGLIPGLESAAFALSDKLNGVSESNEKVSVSLKEMNTELVEVDESLGKLNTTLAPTITQAKIVQDEVGNMALAFALAGVKGDLLAKAQGLVAAGLKVTSQEMRVVSEDGKSYETVLSNVITTVSEAGEVIEDSLTKSAKASADLRRETAELNLEYAKLASQERQIQFEVIADLKVAEIEQGTKRIEKAFEVIRAGIESTEEGLSTLVGGLLNATGSTRTLITELIRKEEKRRADAFKLAEAREKAELKLIAAQTSFFKSGQSLIQINGDNLEPHLTALFLEVLEAASIQINANGQTFLAALPQAL